MVWWRSSILLVIVLSALWTVCKCCFKGYFSGNPPQLKHLFSHSSVYSWQFWSVFRCISVNRMTGPPCMRKKPKVAPLATTSSDVFLSLPLLTVMAQQSRCYCGICSHVFGSPLECAIPTLPVKCMTSSQTSMRDSVLQRPDSSWPQFKCNTQIYDSKCPNRIHGALQSCKTKLLLKFACVKSNHLNEKFVHFLNFF